MFLDHVPQTIIAGDSYSLLLSYGDYPATSGWAIVLYLNGAVSIQIPGTTSGTSYAFDLTSAKTSLLQAGTSAYSIAVTSGTEKHTVESGFITVTEALAGAASKVIATERILNAINAAIEGRITDDVQSLSIAGRSISLIPITELLNLRAVYTKELAVMKGGQSSARRTVPVRLGRM